MSDFAPFNVPIVYDQIVFGTVRSDFVTFDLSHNVLGRPIPWTFAMPIGGCGIGAGAKIGTIAADGMSLTIGDATSNLVGVPVPLNVLVTRKFDWLLPGIYGLKTEWEIDLQSPGAGGDITLGAGGAGAYQRLVVTNIQSGGFIRFVPGLIGAGSATQPTGASRATPSRAYVFDSLTPAGELVACPGEGLAASAYTCGIGPGGDTREPADPHASPHIIPSSYYPYDGGDSSRPDADGFASGGESYTGGARNIPGGGGAPGSGGGVAGSSFPGGAIGLDGGMAFISLRRLA